MSDLPEINFKKEKEDKKKGFIPWLRQKLGFKPASATGGSGVAGSSGASAGGGIANIGRAFGAAKIGGSSGFLGGILAGKGALLATVAVVALGAGVYISNQPSSDKAQSAFDSVQPGDSSYVPSGLRQKHQGSSLDLFRSTNKGSLFDEKAAAAAAKAEAEAKAKAEAEARAKAEAEAMEEQPDPNQMADGMAAKLMGGGMGDLSGSMGGGGNKFSAVGGFGNKFKSKGMSSNIGSGFQAMPKFNERKKMLAMKRQKRAVKSDFSGKKAVRYGKGAYNQAKGLRATQQSYSGGSIDATRGNQDKAWEGTTGGEAGMATGSGGLTSGEGAGIINPASSDSFGGNTGGGDNNYREPEFDNEGEAIISTAGINEVDDTPWASLAAQAMAYIFASIALSLVGAGLVRLGTYLMGSVVPATVALGVVLYWAGFACCIAALALAALAVVNGTRLMTQHGQYMLGAVYIAGGAAAGLAAVAAMTGTVMGVAFMKLAAVAGLCALVGSMMNAPVSKKGDSSQQTVESCHSGADNTGDDSGGSKRSDKYYTDMYKDKAIGNTDITGQDSGTGGDNKDSGVRDLGDADIPDRVDPAAYNDPSSPYYDPTGMTSRTLTYDEMNHRETEKLSTQEKSKKVFKDAIYKRVKPLVQIETGINRIMEPVVGATSDATEGAKEAARDIAAGASEGITEGYDEAVEDGRK